MLPCARQQLPQSQWALTVGKARKAKVNDLDVGVAFRGIQAEVLRLDISVDVAAPVYICQSLHINMQQQHTLSWSLIRAVRG
jgi:hypothetical protein